jgi:gliding motility-associated-like protein
MNWNSRDRIVKFFCVIAFSLFTCCASAQLNNVWYFGRKAGISFNAPASGQPSPFPLINSAMTADEGCSSICDTLGNLLFYTNGVTVYNRNHQVMQNGDNLAGNLSAVQSGTIVPHPGNPNLYYVFTTDALESDFTKGYNYSIIDMSLDAGLGQVTAKNSLLQSSCTERIAAVRHADGISVWIVVNDNNSNTFRAWLINCQGLQPNPVVSTLGVVLDQHQFVNTGMLKATPDGKYICQSHFPLFAENNIPPNFIQLFDFNNTTGVLSNNRTIGFPNAAYTNCEFSPDSKLLYLLRTFDRQVDQLEITLPSTAAIHASRFSFPTPLSNYGIQSAPDGKIYLAASNSRYLSTINAPNIKGSGCSFVNNQVELTFGGAIASLPSFINDLSQSPFNSINAVIIDSCNGTVRFSTTSTITPPLIYEWDFGDGIKSNAANPIHTFIPKDKVYPVRLKITSALQCGTARASKNILPTGVMPVSTAFRSFGGCDSGYVRFELINPPAAGGITGQFLWTFGDGNTSTELNPTHVYNSAGQYHVRLSYQTTTACLNSFNETDVDMLRLSTPLTHSGNQTIYIGQKIKLFAKGAGSNYNWTPPTGLNNASIATPIASPTVTTTYKIRNTNNAGCFAEDSLKITVVELNDVYMPSAFTPNNDGKNDQIYPLMGSKFEIKEYSIYNRWGQKIFTTNKVGTGWDGTINGVVQDSGIYLWILSVTDKEKNSTIEKKGNFALIR